jgi:Nucleotidyl transferase AbiEii toxin, Type IV TA system
VDLASIRRLVIVAMFSDDVLFDKLVLKGGNAISLVYRYGARGSLDVDFSIDGDFDDAEDAGKRIAAALADRFAAAGFVMFDYTFGQRPTTKGGDPKWGGYQIQFKIIERQKHDQLRGDLDANRRHAMVVGLLQQRTFTIEISKWEFCERKVEAELDQFAIFVYTPAMLAIEKIRALCQQMDEYPIRRQKTARARDFYDIYVIFEESKIDLATTDKRDLVQAIFAAKNVPLELMGLIGNYREFHRLDWPSVEATVAEKLKPFDFYFDYVITIAQKLESLGEK